MHPFTSIKLTIEGIADRILKDASRLGYDVYLTECHDNEDNISMSLYMPDEVGLCYDKVTGQTTFDNRHIGEIPVTETSIKDLVQFFKPGYSYEDAIDEQAERDLDHDRAFS